jgi:hypothetical protein
MNKAHFLSSLAEASGTSQTTTPTSTPTSILGPSYPPGSNEEHKSNPAGKIAGGIVGAVVCLLVLLVALIFYLRRSKPVGVFTVSIVYLSSGPAEHQDENPPYGPPHEIPMDSTTTAKVMSRRQAIQSGSDFKCVLYYMLNQLSDNSSIHRECLWDQISRYSTTGARPRSSAVHAAGFSLSMSFFTML